MRGAFASGQAVRIVIRRPPVTVDRFDQAQAEKDAETYLQGSQTQPGTPDLPAAGSMTSSISTIDHMLGVTLSTLDTDVTPSATSRALPDDDHVLLNDVKNDSEDWELEEVGRGLANYNSAQMDRAKGLKR